MNKYLCFVCAMFSDDFTASREFYAVFGPFVFGVVI